MKRKTIIILIIVGVLLVLGAVAGSLFFGSKTHNTTPIRIYIPEGTSQEALVDTQSVQYGRRLYADLHAHPSFRNFRLNCTSLYRVCQWIGHKTGLFC